MNNIKKNPEREENRASNIEPALCVECFEFFGDPFKESLCSKCYKAKYIQSKDLPKEEKIIEKVKKDSISEEKLIEKDRNFCFTCARKVGIFGFACKCKAIFCKIHRLPESHECTFDFKSEGKQKILEANPLVKGSKLEKI